MNLPNLAALILATTFSWTNPSLNSGSVPCSTDSASVLTDLAKVELWNGNSSSDPGILLSSRSELQREGLRDSVRTTPIYPLVWIVAIDTSGNRSCKKYVRVISRVIWFTMTGQRLPKPPVEPGLYITVDQNGRRKPVYVPPRSNR